MDNILVMVLIVAVAVIALSVMALLLDRSRLRRERERHDTSQIDRTLDRTVMVQQSALPPPPADDPRIVISTSPSAGRRAEQQRARTARPDGRIRFGGEPNPSALASPSASPRSEQPARRIGFGAEVGGIERKCPACNHATKSGDVVMECKRCHLHFHASGCWEEFVQDREKPCPQCEATQFERLTLS
jgi:type II secretory pathway pseudopilin PulG